MQQLLGPLKVTIQTAERRAVAGASETAGLLVFRPRERPPTQLHQAPSRLQGCAPSGLSTISGAAEPKSLSRLLRNNGEMEPTKVAITSRSLQRCPDQRAVLDFGHRSALAEHSHRWLRQRVRGAHSQFRSETPAPPPAPLPHFCHLRAALTLPLRGHPCAGAYARAINATACSVERTKVPRRPKMRIGGSCRNKRPADPTVPSGMGSANATPGRWFESPAVRAPTRSAPSRDVCFGTTICVVDALGQIVNS